MLSIYRPRLRTKNWWFPLFTNALNLAVIAAYYLYCHLHEGHDKMTHLQCRRDIALTLCKSTARVRLGGPTAPMVSDVRFDGINHIRISCTQGRCVVCKKNTTTKCEKCDKKLHRIYRFENYHLK